MSYNRPNYKGNKKNDPTVLEVIIVGIFKALWWLIKLPFKGLKFGVGKSGLSVEDRNYLVTKRQQIESTLNSASEIELKHAVMEADKLVDYALKAQGYSGETFADRLRNAQKFIIYNVYDELWQGHKVRNQIAHEHEAKITNQELANAARKLLNYTKTV